jgi:ankyrin repeat protein
MKEISTILVTRSNCGRIQPSRVWSIFIYACVKGNVYFVRQIVNNFSVKNWPKALLLACEGGRSAVVEVLLQNGADINVRDEMGNSLLEVAIRKIKRSRSTHWTSNPPNWMKS